MDTSTNLPFTYIINAIGFANLITNRNNEYILPMSLGALFTGSMVAHKYPEGVSKKYNFSLSTVKLGDVFAHWLPAYIFHRTTKNKVRSHHMLIAVLSPLLYFSYKYKTQQVVDPIKHLMATYPGVPFWVFTLYLGGVSLPNILKK